MRRRVLNVLTVLSLVPAVSLVALWACSFWWYDAVGFWPSPQTRRGYGFVSTRGTLAFLAASEGNGDRWWAWRHDADESGADRFGARAGFVLKRERRAFLVGVPHPLLSMLLIAPLGYRLMRPARKPAAGHCRH